MKSPQKHAGSPDAKVVFPNPERPNADHSSSSETQMGLGGGVAMPVDGGDLDLLAVGGDRESPVASARRAGLALDAWAKTLDPATLGHRIPQLEVTSFLVDLKHYCEQEKVDFETAVQDAIQAYVNSPSDVPKRIGEAAVAAEILEVAPGEHHADLDVLAEYGGYQAIINDPRKARALEDLLDHMTTRRIVDVRNAFRELGWQNRPGETMYSKLYKNGLTLEHTCMPAPSGHNVIGATFWIHRSNEARAVRLAGMGDAWDYSAKDLAKLLDKQAANAV